MSILIEHLDVKVGIGRHEVEHIALPHVCPVFPTDIPTLNEHLLKTILGSEVDIALHLLVIGCMAAIGLHLRPVDLIELDAGIVVGIIP